MRVMVSKFFQSSSKWLEQQQTSILSAAVIITASVLLSSLTGLLSYRFLASRYYNPTTKALEKINSTPLVVDADGYVTFTVTHNSDYVLSDKDLLASTTKATTPAAKLQQTGYFLDFNMLLLLGSIMSISGIGLLLLKRRSREN